MFKIIGITLLLIFSLNLYSTQFTLDIRSSKSQMTLIPDSVIVIDKSDNRQYSFYKTNIINLEAITNVEIDNRLYNELKEINIYNYDGRLIRTLNIDQSNNTKISQILGSINRGIYFIEFISNKNTLLDRKSLYVVGSGSKTISNDFNLNYLIEQKYDILIYKYGYENIQLNDVSPNEVEPISILMDPQYDKFYTNAYVKINGIYKNGKTDTETSYSGNVKYSTYDSKLELADSLIIDNTELRLLDNNCLEKVMEQNYRTFACEEVFPLAVDSAYFCGLVCNNGNVLSDFRSSSVHCIFNSTMDTLINLTIFYRNGKYEFGGNPSEKRIYRDIFIYFKNIPITEYKNKFTANLDKSEIEKYLQIFNWESIYYGVDLHPPFDYSKSKSNLTGETELMDNAKVKIEIFKSK